MTPVANSGMIRALDSVITKYFVVKTTPKTLTALKSLK